MKGFFLAFVKVIVALYIFLGDSEAKLPTGTEDDKANEFSLDPAAMQLSGRPTAMLLPLDPAAMLPVGPSAMLMPVHPAAMLPVNPSAILPVDPAAMLPMGPAAMLPMDPAAMLLPDSSTSAPPLRKRCVICCATAGNVKERRKLSSVSKLLLCYRTIQSWARDNANATW